MIRSSDERKKPEMAKRLRVLYDGLVEIVDQLKPGVLVVEQLYSHYAHPRTAILMGHARGVIFLAGAQRDLQVLSYASTRIKKTITGAGRASKEQMQMAMLREFHLPKMPEPHDVADALAVASCHYHAAFEIWRTGRRAKAAMITKITGVINRVLDEDIRLQVGPFEYQVLIPEFVRRQNTQDATAVARRSLSTFRSIFGSQRRMSSRMVPRKIGFLHEVELEFFDLFCTVDKIGVKKALKAMGRPIKEIAEAIQRKDAKWLTTLPGIGKTTADQIIATLNAKVTKYQLLMPSETSDGPATAAANVNAVLFEDAYAALMSVGLTPTEARTKIDLVIASGRECKTVEDVISLVFKRSE